MDKHETIEYPIWVHRGNMFYNTECLAPNDPDHPYNYLRNKYGVNPEEYGIKDPLIYRSIDKLSKFRQNEYGDYVIPKRVFESILKDLQVINRKNDINYDF